jgi:hypothetical protein
MGRTIADVPVQTLRQVGLARLLRLGVAGAIPPLWLEIVILHFRGSFHSRFMWIPILSLPPVLASGASSALLQDERRARAIFRPLAWVMAGVGTAGTLFHLRGVGRQMGGFYNWRYNAVTGPPLPAPPQVALLGLLGALASAPPARGETRRLVRWMRVVDALSYVLLMIEAGYNHWMGGYFNKVMYTPIILSPLLALTHLAALAHVRAARAVEGPLSVVATVAGLVGFGFHIWNINRRTGGFGWQNLFYGAPMVAPLQLAGQGILGLLAAVFGASDEGPPGAAHTG